ncbi:TspO/MBR family protein [Oryzobacter telluris]|uniref:TspO/MBR family protein n=1 Tax=Oryzobacter telluris TaxID=3149179 RepID=UPI00370DE099
MSSHAARPQVEASDRRRQVAVTLAEVFCVVGTLVGVGVLGTRVEESSGGALAADATLLAPAGPAFLVWTPIYLGLAAYTVWQWLPEQTTDRRHRAIGWLVAASMVLNALWLLVTQQGWIWVSVGVIAALAGVLGLLVRRLTENPSYGSVEAVVVDGTFGLYLGWVAVAACANVTAAFVSSGVDPGPAVAQGLAVVVLVVAAVLSRVFAERLGGRWAVAVAMAWGLAWIAYGRVADEPRSVVVGLAALVAALVVLAAVTRAQRLVRGVVSGTDRE